MAAVPEPAAEGRLVGRRAELASLAGAVEEMEHGRGSIVEIRGEPGIGKSRLAHALLALAERRGIPAVRAHAVRGNTTPWQLIGDAWAARHGAGARAWRFDASGEPPAAWMAGHVVVLDDLHHCDPASATLLAQLVRSAVPRPLLLALVHRPRQTSRELRGAIEEGVRAGNVQRLEPGPLGPDAVAALVADQRAAAGPSPCTEAELRVLADRLWAEAGGNPQYVRLLAAADGHPGNGTVPPGTDTAGLPRAAMPLIAELDALSVPAALTASAAAVAGGAFRPEDVARICGLDMDRALDALAELERADLVRAGDGTGGLVFRHPVVGQVAYELAGVSFRLRAHRRALELLTGSGRVRERARHAERLLGTDAALATRTLAQAAVEITPQEPTTATRWLHLVLEALPDGGTGTVDRTETELAYCRALIASGRLDEARTRAHELLGRRPSTLDDRQLLRAHALCAEAERQLGRYAEATAIVGAALALLPRPLPAPLPPEASELIIEFGLVHVLRGSHEQARDLLAEAVRTPGATGDTEAADRTVLRVLSALCATHAGDLTEAGAEVDRCVRLVDALPDPLAGRTPETLALLGSAELYLERFTDAARHLHRGLTAAESGPQRPIQLHRLLGLAMAEQWTGRLDASRQHALEAEALARSLGARPAVTLAQAIRATAHVWSHGRASVDEAVALVEEATSAAAPPGHSWWAASATGLLAQAQLLAGDAAGCRRTLLDAIGVQRLPQVRPFSRPLLLSLLVTATLESGDHAEADRLLRIAEAESERLGLAVQEAYVRRARAQLHLAEGEHGVAAKLFELAAETFRSATMPVEYAWTLAAGARAFHEAHRPDTALRQLHTADFVARTHAARLVRERVADLRAELSADQRGAQALDLLSDREREIAGLAAAGLRNREIAERLFLSPRTVETHIARAYRKLGVSSRVALSDALRRDS
ncbi:LuxR C-terminal-related transcriptional regulator [Streptomyces sp. NPDC088387]|uniref:helix-turn-helix transcriptional regulator n=1 Tax=Streptomyces sp. NPDC088387 TaxID=3365859 RepID=UPI0037F72F82